MKKIMFLFLAISAMLLSGCSKDEPVEDPQEPTILGSWKYEIEDGFIYTFIYTFEKDGTGKIHYKRTGNEKDPAFERYYDFTYSIKDNKLTIKQNHDGEEQTSVSTIVSITDKALTLKFIDIENGKEETAIWHRVE